jgi:hypothetical protein
VITWTITPNTEHPKVPGQLFWEVNGENPDESDARQDIHDPRHFPTRLAAIEFLIDHHMKMRDTLHVSGDKTGRSLRIGLVKIGDKLEYDVGTQQIPHPADLIDWLDATLKPGDTVAYLVEPLSQMG